MKRNKNILRAAMWASCVLATAATGCVRDIDGIYGSDEPAGTLRIKLGVETMEPTTRATAAALPGEADIYDLTLLFFDYTTDGSGAFVTSYIITSETPPSAPGATDGVPLGSELGLDIGSGAGAALNPANNYSILAVANMDTFTSQAGWFIDTITNYGENPIGTEAQMREYIFNMPMALLLQNMLPMSGSSTKMAADESVNLSFERIVSRIDVQNMLEDQYELISVSLYGASMQTMLWSDDVIEDLEYSSVGGPFMSVSKINEYVPDSGTGAQIVEGQLVGGFYCFENSQSDPDANPDETTSIVVGLRSVADGGAPMYYRIPIRPENAAQSMMRNNIYRVSIRSVSDFGAATEADAEDGKQLGLGRRGPDRYRRPEHDGRPLEDHTPRPRGRGAQL